MQTGCACCSRLGEKVALARSLAEQNFRFDTALANMSHGLCMFDSNHRLLVWNKRFCEIYKIPPEAVSPGITLRKLVELSAARGNHPNLPVDDIVSENGGTDINRRHELYSSRGQKQCIAWIRAYIIRNDVINRLIWMISAGGA